MDKCNMAIDFDSKITYVGYSEGASIFLLNGDAILVSPFTSWHNGHTVKDRIMDADDAKISDPLDRHINQPKMINELSNTRNNNPMHYILNEIL
jgi:hypothetical protein